MKTKKLKAVIVLILALIVAALTFTACGGNGNGDVSDNAKAAIETVKDISGGATAIPSEATHVTAESTLSQPGNYYVDSSFDGKITVSCDGVTLYLSGANITNGKKVIESTFDMTITLIGNNSVSNSNTAGSNAIDCTGNLVINGSGSLSVDATKNGIKAKSISVIDATLDIKADKDGLHAEIDAYDEATVAPSPAYKDGGFVYLKNAKVKAVSTEDGIAADTFVYITGNGNTNITAGGGAPESVTSGTAETASGKGIKAGAIDWGTSGTDIEWKGYLVYIDGGTVDVNSNDDALHSDSEIFIKSGTVDLSTGNKAINADGQLTVSGGKVTINKCFEDIDAGKSDIAEGTIVK